MKDIKSQVNLKFTCFTKGGKVEVGGMPVILATWEVEAAGSGGQGKPWLSSE